MNRRPPTRIAAAWLLLLFLLLRGVDAFGLHRCPLHQAAEAPAGHSMHGSHGSAPAVSGERGTDPEPPCSCVGMCCLAATGVVPPPDAPVALQATVSAVAVAAVEAMESVRPLHVDHLLPYGLAPPLLG